MAMHPNLARSGTAFLQTLVLVTFESCIYSAQKAHEESGRILNKFDSINNSLAKYKPDTNGDARHHTSDFLLLHRTDSMVHWLDSLKRDGE